MTERYVLSKMIARQLADGHTEKEVALIHNQGRVGQCRKGTNRYGAKYDSCAYRDQVFALYTKLINK